MFEKFEIIIEKYVLLIKGITITGGFMTKHSYLKTIYFTIICI